jgi:hypothetical protein
VFELGGEAGVDGFELLGVVAGEDDSAPDAAGGAHGDGVVAAAAAEGAVGASGDGGVLFVGVEEQVGVGVAGQRVGSRRSSGTDRSDA